MAPSTAQKTKSDLDKKCDQMADSLPLKNTVSHEDYLKFFEDFFSGKFHKSRDEQKMPKEFYKGRYAYNKLAKEAKMLYQACNEVLDDSIWALDKMK